MDFNSIFNRRSVGTSLEAVPSFVGPYERKALELIQSFLLEKGVESLGYAEPTPHTEGDANPNMQLTLFLIPKRDNPRSWHFFNEGGELDQYLRVHGLYLKKRDRDSVSLNAMLGSAMQRWL